MYREMKKRVLLAGLVPFFALTTWAKWTLDVSKTVYAGSYVVYNDDGPDGAPTWVINVDSFPNAQNINAKEFCLWAIKVQETNVLDLTTFETDTGRSIHGIGGTSFQGNARLEGELQVRRNSTLAYQKKRLIGGFSFQ